MAPAFVFCVGPEPLDEYVPGFVRDLYFHSVRMAFHIENDAVIRKDGRTAIPVSDVQRLGPIGRFCLSNPGCQPFFRICVDGHEFIYFS